MAVAVAIAALITPAIINLSQTTMINTWHKACSVLPRGIWRYALFAHNMRATPSPLRLVLAHSRPASAHICACAWDLRGVVKRSYMSVYLRIARYRVQAAGGLHACGCHKANASAMNFRRPIPPGENTKYRLDTRAEVTTRL